MSNVDIAALANAAAELEDQTQEVASTDFDNTPEEGVTVGRLISYIELGKHSGGTYQGKPKPDADKVRMEFELLGPKNEVKYEKDGKEEVFYQTVSIEVKKSLSDKAKFKKLFKKLQYGREDKKHIAQMLGEAFIITIYINEVEKDGKKRKYVNLDKDGEFGISAPFQIDPLTQQRTAYDIKAATQPIRLFLWDNPVKEMWDSLFIDGTREVKKEDGTTEQVSKNWLQERITSAKNFGGSPLHTMLTGVTGEDLEAAEENAAEQAAQLPQEDAPELPDTPVDKSTGSVNEATQDDPLAALGLVAK